MDTAPERCVFPSSWSFDPQAHPVGRIVYLRRTNDRGVIELLGMLQRFDPLQLWKPVLALPHPSVQTSRQ